MREATSLVTPLEDRLRGLELRVAVSDLNGVDDSLLPRKGCVG